METIQIQLVEAKFNKEDNYSKYLRIENEDAYEFLSLPDLGQLSFWKDSYDDLISNGEIEVKYIIGQPLITYAI